MVSTLAKTRDFGLVMSEDVGSNADSAPMEMKATGVGLRAHPALYVAGKEGVRQ